MMTGPEDSDAGQPQVSVVIPLFNKAKSVGATVSSVLAQTISDFEVVIINDGSTDGSGDVVRRVNDSRVRLIEQVNGGGSAARNRGIAEARSELIAFIDADDLWMPHFLKTVLDLRARFPEAGAYATAFVALQNGRVRRFPHVGVSHLLEGELIKDYFRSCTQGSSMVWSSSVMIPKHVFDRVGGFPVGVCNGEDLHMWARIALEFPICWSTVECAVWNLDAENRIAGRVVMPDAPFAKLLEAAIAEGRVPAEQVKSVRAYIAKYRIHYAGVSIAHGDRPHGLRLLWLARAAAGVRFEWWKAVLRALTPNWVLQSRSVLRRQSRTG
jgi:glycosyltransferase involved in cell wall biosynthesis